MLRLQKFQQQTWLSYPAKHSKGFSKLRANINQWWSSTDKLVSFCEYSQVSALKKKKWNYNEHTTEIKSTKWVVLSTAAQGALHNQKICMSNWNWAYFRHRFKKKQVFVPEVIKDNELKNFISVLNMCKAYYALCHIKSIWVWFWCAVQTNRQLLGFTEIRVQEHWMGEEERMKECESSLAWTFHSLSGHWKPPSNIQHSDVRINQ